MKSIFIFSLLIPIFAFGQNRITKRYFDSVNEAGVRSAIGKPLAPFKAQGDKTTITNDSLIGKVVFINLWFETCPPCMTEMNALNDLFDQLKDNKKFEFLSLTFESPEVIRKIKERYHIRYKVAYLNQDNCYMVNQGLGFPTHLILDSMGTIKYLHSGGSTDSNSAKEFIFTEIYPEIKKELKNSPVQH